MIVRQFCARHGRSAVQSQRVKTSECIRYYATRIDARPSQERAPVQEREIRRPRLPSNPDKEIYSPSNAYYRQEAAKKKTSRFGSRMIENFYKPQQFQNHLPSIDKIDLPLLLACQTHLGHATSLWNPRNSSYIMGVRDGIHIISMEITAAYLRRACKVVQEVARRGGIILFVGTRDGQEELVVRVAQMAGGYHVFDRWVPGSLTNGQQLLGRCRLQVVDPLDKEIVGMRPYTVDRAVARPDLVVCLNPLENEVCLHECGLFNVPTIGIIDTDADASWVTYPIPANDDSMRSVALLAGALGRAAEAGQQKRLKLAKQGHLTYPQLNLKGAYSNIGRVESDDSSKEVPDPSGTVESDDPSKELPDPSRGEEENNVQLV